MGNQTHPKEMHFTSERIYGWLQADNDNKSNIKKDKKSIFGIKILLASEIRTSILQKS